MESLAKYKGIKLRGQLWNDTIKKVGKKLSQALCPDCHKILLKEIQDDNADAFDEYLEKAIEAIKAEEVFEIETSLIKEIARMYRNELFHGNFFEDMDEIDKLIMNLPENLQRNLPLVFQAIVAMIGVNLILGIDYSQMIALKRSMH